MPRSKRKVELLQGARVYLSGPMDFVASRSAEKQFGWRNRVSEFLQAMGVTVFDPWFKPDVRGLHEYGREDVNSADKIKERWTYADDRRGAKTRAWCAQRFWETLHIDLRMVDTSDFAISYCPTNIYSVGTPMKSSPRRFNINQCCSSARRSSSRRCTRCASIWRRTQKGRCC
jgi:hypothetical protein